MTLGQTARQFAVLPLLALVVTAGTFVGSPGSLKRALWGKSPSPMNAVVTGQVTKGGYPVVGAIVQIAAANGMTYLATTDQDGAYRVKLPEGGATVVLHPPTPVGLSVAADDASAPIGLSSEESINIKPLHKVAFRKGEQTVHFTLDV